MGIETLVKDIQDILTSDKKMVEGVVAEFATTLSSMLVRRLAEESKPPTLRISNLGWPDRKLWYSINKPHIAERLDAATRLKFLYGDILEEVLLFLAAEAGHEVTRQQENVSLFGVPGHIDAFVDGDLVDVKSASSFSFNEFAAHLSQDKFGYLTQLSAYGAATASSRGAFLVADKTLGKICLDIHEFPNDTDWEKVVYEKRKMLASPIPPRCYEDQEETYYKKKTGNRKLGVECSYCPFKDHCWPFLQVNYSSGKPVFYTRVLDRSRFK